MVPNWARIELSNGSISHSSGGFTGSGTPQWEYGSEAARTTWRVALDAAMYPQETGSTALPFLGTTSFNP